MDSGFQSPGFRIPRAKNFWIPESGFPYMGRSDPTLFLTLIKNIVIVKIKYARDNLKILKRDF